MGRRGPRPLTKEMLRMRGSWRADLIRNQPVAPRGCPSCPAWLDRDAKMAWRFVVKWLEVMQLLSHADRNALSRYCQTYSRWKKVELHLQKHGETYPFKDEKGRVLCFLEWPQVAIAHRLGKALTRLEQEFGLTPKARTSIDPRLFRPHQAEERAFHEFISRGGPAPPRRRTGGKSA